MMQDPLYERLGGAEGIAQLVDVFYERVLQDAELSRFFVGVPMDKLRHMQSQFFSAALGGPVVYAGRPLIHAHQHLRLRREHLQRFVEHLFECLPATLDEDQRYDVVSRINLYSDEVLGAAAGYSD